MLDSLLIRIRVDRSGDVSLDIKVTERASVIPPSWHPLARVVGAAASGVGMVLIHEFW